MAIEKKEKLRSAIRNKLSINCEKLSSDIQIINNFKKFIFPIFQNKSIGIFYPTDREVNILPIAKELAFNQLYLPVCLDVYQIEFYPWKFGEELFKSRFFNSIYEPSTINISPGIPNFIITPVLACDYRGFRLGNGKGYYDRYLEKHSNKIISIGVCYDFQLLEEVPIENHDQKLDIIVTDKQIINNSLLDLNLNSNAYLGK